MTASGGTWVPNRREATAATAAARVILAAFARHGGGCADADRRLVAAEPVAHAAHQHGDVGALPAAVGVKLVEHEEIEALGIGDDGPVERVLPRHQQLEHHEVGEQDVGLAARMRSRSSWRLLARVAGEGRPRCLWQAGLLDEFVELLELAVGQRVHRIDDDGARARLLPGRAGADRASMIGMKKQSDLPEPVPVVTTKLCRAFALAIACAWWR